jgi:hypothetical protein
MDERFELPMPLHTHVIETDFENHLISPRMRAFYWRYQAAQKDGDDIVPHISDLSCDAFAGLEAWSLRLLALPDGDFLYTQYGHEISKTVGFSLVGKSLGSSSGPAFEFFRKCYQRVRDEHRPLLTFSSALASRCVASWHRLIVPALDDVGQMNLITILQPVKTQEAIITALMRAVSDPILIIRMVRDEGPDVIDANIIDSNKPAKELLNCNYLHHSDVSSVIPVLLQQPYRDCLASAYAQGETTTLEEPFEVAGRAFTGLTASPIGDGAAVLLRAA